ncbi:MAG: Ig-like domain repeat protein [Nitrospirae bacterium]|nr:Ig-like domain repeat protein [Nitrospirota bacterium]
MSDQFGASTQQNLLTGGDGAKLYGWYLLNSANTAIADVNITLDGYLYVQAASMMSNPAGATFNVPFVYQQVTGDFDYTTFMASGMPINHNYGFVVRDPASLPNQNWIGLCNYLHDQTYSYNTVNSSSSTGPVTFTAVYLRIKRVGNVFTTHSSSDGITWARTGLYTRDDFGNTVQLGVYSADSSGAFYDYFQPPIAITTLTSDTNPASNGSTVTFTATVIGLGNSPTGTVTFMDGSSTLGTGTLNGSYQAAYSTSSLSIGTHSITAVYGGDSINSGSSSTAVNQVINAASTINAAITMPHLTDSGAESQSGNFCNNPLPVFTLSCNFAATDDAAVSLPVFTSTGSVDGTDVCTASIKAPVFKAAGVVINGTGARGNIVLPAFSVDTQTAAAANIALPIFSTDSAGTSGNISKGSLILSAATLNGNIITSPLISAALSMPRFGISNNYNTGTIGKLTYDVPVVAIAGDGSSGGLASSNLDLGIFTASGSGYVEYVGNAVNQLSLFSIEGVLVSDESLSMYATIVLNTATKAVSKYDGVNFNAYGRHDSGTHLAADSNGIYVIGGDSDDGQPITCSMQTGLLEFGSGGLKQVLNAYFHAQAANAPVTLKVTADGGQEIEYQFIPSNRTSRTTLCRIEGRHFEFVIEGTAPLEINSIEAAVSYLRRMR